MISALPAMTSASPSADAPLSGLELMRRMRELLYALDGLPPPRDVSVHPDDLAELQRHAEAEGWPLARSCDTFGGVHLIPDPAAPRLARAA